MDTPVVYDKAKYHFGSIQEAGLPDIHAYIHTGMFLGWLINNNMLNSEFVADFGEDIPKFIKREITAAQLFELWDGALVDDMLTDVGNKFTASYFAFENGQYINDYIQALASDLPSEFHVEDSWANFDKISKIIDSRYLEWKKSKPWWQFW